ncbi:DUF5691 domain-containing protein [Labedaea rhizosphaerae]|uniref:Uncharacterized protein n=1 Tax=Labedaea rhizosphaerae TaxID=598644 RepID=A0A4R6RRM7_LABRH|nr:DUF5691 domain-containing protein [Labedaea rhizosphaerae]TDP89354.1 hypothetical protein EV186_1131 [Labedaea rhizosphaerae]
MTGWDDLVATAMLGTARRPAPVDTLPGPIREHLDPTGDPAHDLLAAAALLGGYRKAGTRAVTDSTPVPAAEPDPRPVVRDAAATRLGRILNGDHADLLGEWLTAAAAAGYRPPPEHLPALADAARAKSALRPLVAAAAGTEAAWLGAIRPDWAFLGTHATTDTDDAWRFGSPAQRRAWLAGALRTEPEAARKALQETWSAEPAESRVDLLEVLGAALKPEDAAFLERALDDRAQDVRRLAGELLSCLPGSELGRRMAERMAALVSVRRRSLGRRGVLVFELPTECDDAMKRDGIVASPPKGTGQRAWWLRQLLAATPLSFWDQYADSPADLLRMPFTGADGDTDDAVVLAGLAGAAARQHDPAWARALLEADPAGPHVADLVAVLPTDEWTAIISGIATRVTAAQFAELTVSLPRPWPVSLGKVVLDWLDGRPNERAVAWAAGVAARAVPKECLDHPMITREGQPAAAPWRVQLVQTLLFRRRLHEELS